MKPKQYTRLPHEVFQIVTDASTTSDRVKLLQEHGSFAVKTILQGNFHPDLVFDLPKGAPKFEADNAPAGRQISPIGKHIQNLAKCLVDNSKEPFARMRKERIFIGLLEIVHAKDAEILIAMKDKELTKLYPKITASLVRKAFPELLPA